MIFDDDEDLLDMVSVALTSQGFKTNSLMDGNDVENSVSRYCPDVILMDVYLANHDGRMLCKQLKNAVSFQHIPVILYSAGNITADSINDSLADAFINKPFTIKGLAEKIRSLVE